MDLLTKVDDRVAQLGCLARLAVARALGAVAVVSRLALPLRGDRREM